MKKIKIKESELVDLLKNIINESHLFDHKKYTEELKQTGDLNRYISSVENFVNSEGDEKDSNLQRMKEISIEIVSKLTEKFGRVHKNAIRHYLNNLAKKIAMDIHLGPLNQKINEQENERYMFFSNLEQIQRQCKLLLDLEESIIESILENGHDWAQDHIATAKESIDQVFDFIMNETKTKKDDMNLPVMEEGKKKSGTKLCSRGKAAAKAKFKVYPSAYSNGFAVQVCQGRMKGLDGKKRCSPPYC